MFLAFGILGTCSCDRKRYKTLFFVASSWILHLELAFVWYIYKQASEQNKVHRQEPRIALCVTHINVLALCLPPLHHDEQSAGRHEAGVYCSEFNVEMQILIFSPEGEKKNKSARFGETANKPRAVVVSLRRRAGSNFYMSLPLPHSIYIVVFLFFLSISVCIPSLQKKGCLHRCSCSKAPYLLLNAMWRQEVATTKKNTILTLLRDQRCSRRVSNVYSVMCKV